MVSPPFGTTNEHGYAEFELIAFGKSADNEALVVWPSRDFRRDMTWHVTWRDMTWRDMT